MEIGLGLVSVQEAGVAVTTVKSGRRLELIQLGTATRIRRMGVRIAVATKPTNGSLTVASSGSCWTESAGRCLGRRGSAAFD